MSYTKLHTPALVLSAYNVGEASRTYTLFTPLVGTVFAKAQGVRELKSRHRFALQTFSYVDVSLVAGKGGWRITNATPLYSLYAVFDPDPQKKRVVTRITSLLKRLITGEQHDEKLFTVVMNGFEFLQQQQLDQKETVDLEIFIVLRVLHILGYVKDEEVFIPFLYTSEIFSLEELEKFKPNRSKAVAAINTALKASQL